MTRHATPAAAATVATVYHVSTFGQPVNLAHFPTGLEAVATVAIPAGLTVHQALDRAYQLTNNIDDSWTKNTGVTAQGQAAARGGARSTSVADVIEIAGERFEVSPMGFTLIRVIF